MCVCEEVEGPNEEERKMTKGGEKKMRKVKEEAANQS